MTVEPLHALSPPVLPVSVDVDRRRRRRSWVATAVVGVIVLGPAAYLGWRLAALTAPTGRPQSFDVVAVVLLGLSLLVTVRVLRLTRTPRRLRPLPRSMQRALGDLVELSTFGTGTLRGWTVALPTTDLRRLAVPEPFPERESDTGPDNADDAAAADGLAADPRPRRPRPTHRQPVTPKVTPAEPAPALGPTRPHVVGRGETWWTLAAATLGDGRRWRALVELNSGRQVAPGIAIGADTALRRGWEIELPVVPDQGNES